MRLAIRSHHFIVSPTTLVDRAAISTFTRNWENWVAKYVRGQGWKNTLEKRFAFKTQTTGKYFFHINQLDGFLQECQARNINVEKEPDQTAVINDEIELRINGYYTLREEQKPASKFLIDVEPKHQKLLPLQTGKGKTPTALISAAALKCRIGIQLKPEFIHRFEQALFGTEKDVAILDVCEHEHVVIISKTKELESFLAVLREQKTAGIKMPHKVVVISQIVYSNWIDLFLELGDLTAHGYPCNPQDFYEYAGLGVKLIDEVHKSWHMNFKCECFTNVPRSWGMTATLLHDSQFLEKTYNLVYPPASRYNPGKLDKYVTAIRLNYSIAGSRKFATAHRGNPAYSHAAFEKSILADADFFKSYVKMMVGSLEKTFFKHARSHHKTIIFVASVEMATKLTDALERIYPDLDVCRYVATMADPYENLLDATITVSTVGSAGTGHDVKNLISVDLTVAIDSIQANIQTLGRLRKLSDTDVYFTYYCCTQIPQHMRYADKKQAMLKQRALCHETRYHGGFI